MEPGGESTLETVLLLLAALGSLGAAFAAFRSSRTVADDFALKLRPYILYRRHDPRPGDRILLYFQNHGAGVGRLFRVRASGDLHIEIGAPLWVGPGELGEVALYRDKLDFGPSRDLAIKLSLYVMDMQRTVYRDELRIRLRTIDGVEHCLQEGEFFRPLTEPVDVTFEPVNWPEPSDKKLDIGEWWGGAGDPEPEMSQGTGPEPEKYSVVASFAAFLDLVRRLYSHSDTAERTVRGRFLWAGGILSVVFLAPEWWRWIVTIAFAYWVLDVITYLAKVLLVDTGPIHGFRRQMLLFLGNYIIVAGLLSSVYVAWQYAREYSSQVLQATSLHRSQPTLHRYPMRHRPPIYHEGVEALPDRVSYLRLCHQGSALG